MERIELKTSAGTRVALGMLVATAAFPLLILAGVVGIVVTVALVSGYIWLCVAMSKRRLFLDAAGVTVKGMRTTKQIAWDDVDHYTFWSMDQRAAYAASGQGAIAVLIAVAAVAIVRAIAKSGKQDHRRFSQGRLTLLTRDNVKIPIDARYVKVGEALDRVFTEIHPRLRARAGGALPTDFGPFQLTDTQLMHVKKGMLGLADIEKITAGGSRIAVKKRDKRLSWASAPMKGIKNVMLFLEVAAERGLIVNANAEVFMPLPVVDKLRDAKARQSSMPAARVVSR